MSFANVPAFPYPVAITLDANTQYDAAVRSLLGVMSADGTSPPGNLFHVTGHWLCAWLAGWIGAVLATTFQRRARQLGGVHKR